MAFVQGARAAEELLVLVLVLLAVAPVPGQVKTDAELLLDLRDSFNNGRDKLPNWQGSSPCDWAGVGCYAGQVTDL